MNARQYMRTWFLVGSLAVALPPQGPAQSDSNAKVQQTLVKHDGQHDFDFEIGAWKTHLRRLQHPLTGSATWVEYEGTTVVRKVGNGHANLVELEVNGPTGRIEALSLRLYNPQSHQWSLNFANSQSGTVGVPTIGEFRNGRGEFVDQEQFNGRAILVRFVISQISPDSCHFEQAYSDDGGKTWETNWIANDTRVTVRARPGRWALSMPRRTGRPLVLIDNRREMKRRHILDHRLHVGTGSAISTSTSVHGRRT